MVTTTFGTRLPRGTVQLDVTDEQNLRATFVICDRAAHLGVDAVRGLLDACGLDPARARRDLARQREE